MSKKNKLMLAAAIAAVVLLVGSGVARCSLAAVEPDRQDAAAQGERAAQEGQADSEYDAQAEQADAPEESGLASLVGSSWVGSQDADRTLTIVQGAFVETKDGQNSVTYWTIDSEEQTAEGTTSILLASSPANTGTSSVVCAIRTENGKTKIACDALADVYVCVLAEQATLEFDGITDDLADAMGASAEEIKAAVCARAAALSPQATRATWDEEVWCDFANNTATTTFTLADGASTMISVTRYPDGAIEAL